MTRAGRAAALALVLGAVACGGGDAGSPCGPTRATVTRVVDGDTVELATGEKVRYLLVDTPESTGGATDCYGAEAAQANRDLVEGREVDLVYDEARCDDQFGRHLAYVSVAGREVNTLLVERGYACVLYIPPAGSARHEEFAAREEQAKAAGKGMWSACAVVTCE